MAAEPGRATMLWRGATRRCPRCGAGKLFHAWFRMVPECPRCGLRFEREPGYWAGALAINMIITGGLFTVVFIPMLIVTVPDIPVGLMLAVCLPIVALGPIVAYPFSKTLWVAIDRAILQRLDANERPDEQSRRV
ncbi:MAG: DUF983 domain-containing protein [Actinomycetota bacterium]